MFSGVGVEAASETSPTQNVKTWLVGAGNAWHSQPDQDWKLLFRIVGVFSFIRRRMPSPGAASGEQCQLD